MRSPALLLSRLRCRLCPDSWALLCLLCDCLWALRCLLLCRYRSLPSSVLRLAWLLCCLLPCCSWGSDVACAWTRRRSSAPCVTASGRVAAYGSASLGRSSASCDVLLCCCAACYFAARGAPWSLTPGFVGIFRPLCDNSWVLRRLPLCRSWSLTYSVCCLSRLPCCLLLCRSWGSAAALAWIRRCSSALCAIARERYAAYQVAYLGRAPTPCAVSLGYCAALCSAACGALLSAMHELVNAPPPFVRRLLGCLLLPTPCVVSPSCCVVSCSTARRAPSPRTPWLVGAPQLLVRPHVGAPPPIALPLSMDPLPRELSFDVVVLPPALLRVGACWLLRLESLRPVCDGSWALCCPSLCAPNRSPGEGGGVY